MAEDFTLSGSENSIDLMNPANKVPPPPIQATVQELETALAQAEALQDDLNKGFGKTATQFASRAEFDRAKRENLKLIRETLPAQIQERQAWENRYSVKRGQIGADTVVMPAAEVFQRQQNYEAVFKKPTPAVKRYLDAVKAARELQAKIDKRGTKENKMSDADKSLMMASAWNQVKAAINPEVQNVLGREIVTEIDKYGQIVRTANLPVTGEMDTIIRSHVDAAMRAADKQFSTQVVETEDRWGRPLTYTRIRDEKQSVDYTNFESKVSAILQSGATPQQIAAEPATPARTITAPATPADVAPGAEFRGEMGARIEGRTMAAPVTTPRTPADVAPGQDFRGAMTGRLEAGLGPREPVTQTPAGGGGGTGGGGAGGGTGRGGAGTGGGAGPAGTATIDGKRAGLNWEENIRKYFPKQAWLLDEVDRATNADLFDLLKEYSVPRPLTQEEIAIFAARLENTGYYKGLATSGKIREIKAVVGDLGFDSTDFTRFVNRAINLGWEGARLTQETYREVFSTNPDGSYINPVAAQRALKSNDYLGLANISRAYFNPVGTNTANSRIVRVLTGEQNAEDFTRQERELAKQRYSHLAPLIDQGLSLEDIASNYKRTAAAILERDPNSIDMTQADYEIALRFGEEGKQRVMTNGEWERLLRTDPRYGWEKTENAKAEARALANSVVQAFGRII